MLRNPRSCRLFSAVVRGGGGEFFWTKCAPSLATTHATTRRQSRRPDRGRSSLRVLVLAIYPHDDACRVGNGFNLHFRRRARTHTNLNPIHTHKHKYTRVVYTYRDHGTLWLIRIKIAVMTFLCAVMRLSICQSVWRACVCVCLCAFAFVCVVCNRERVRVDGRNDSSIGTGDDKRRSALSDWPNVVSMSVTADCRVHSRTAYPITNFG